MLMLTDDVSTTRGEISLDWFQLLLSDDTDGWWMCTSATSCSSHSQSLYQCHCMKLTQESFGGGCAKDRHRSASVAFDWENFWEFRRCRLLYKDSIFLIKRVEKHFVCMWVCRMHPKNAEDEVWLFENNRKCSNVTTCEVTFSSAAV